MVVSFQATGTPALITISASDGTASAVPLTVNAAAGLLPPAYYMISSYDPVLLEGPTSAADLSLIGVQGGTGYIRQIFPFPQSVEARALEMSSRFLGLVEG